MFSYILYSECIIYNCMSMTLSFVTDIESSPWSIDACVYDCVGID